MITNLSDLYVNISQQLPGVSTPILETEFKRAEKKACRDASLWSEDYELTTEEDVYTYYADLPVNTDLELCIELKDGNSNRVDVNLYEVDFVANAEVDGYSLSKASYDAEAGLEGEYTATGATFNGANVYENSTWTLFKAVDGVDQYSSLYAVALTSDYDALVADPTDFPPSYYAALPPASGFSGTLIGQGDYAGSVVSSAIDFQASAAITLDAGLVDTRYPETFTATLTLSPRVGFSTLPSAEMTKNAELITELARASLLQYPTNFPWSNLAKSELVMAYARKLIGLAKFERYRKYQRSSVVMRAPYGFI